jgi:hypothetical protein
MECPEKKFTVKLRQGDPLSPLLFVLAADLLQTLINRAKELGHISLPLPTRAGTNFPVIQYADDTLIIMEACESQLTHLKELLDAFASSTGLKVIFSKSVMVPINTNLPCQLFGLLYWFLAIHLFRLATGNNKANSASVHATGEEM